MVRQNVTITGNCNANNGQYYIDLAPLPKPTARIALSLPTSYAYSTYKMTTKLDLVCYLHRTDFIPVISTWTSAINAGYYTNWTGLASHLVRKYLPKALATAQGRLC